VYKGRTIESLAEQSGYSASTLRRYVRERLTQYPPVLDLPQPASTPVYLIIDGLWFGTLFCLMIYRISGWPLIIHWSFSRREWGSHIAKDLEYLKQQGYQFSGFVTDGGIGVTKAVQKVFPHRPHQICLVHVHREAGRGLGKFPQSYQLQKLKRLVDHLFLIESKEALRWWINEVLEWARVNKEYLQEVTHDPIRRKWWYTHKKVRRTVRILLSAPETSFVFVKGHPLIPRSTNEVEGINALLTRRFGAHTGLADHRWKQFISWCIYFRNLYYVSKLKQK